VYKQQQTLSKRNYLEFFPFPKYPCAPLPPPGLVARHAMTAIYGNRASRLGSRRIVFLLLLIQLVLTVPFICTSYVSFNSCFLTKDPKGICPGSNVNGVEAMFGIHGGQAFQLVTSGIIFFGFGFATLRILNRRPSQTNIGIVVGASLLLSYLALSTAFKYATLSTTVSFVQDHKCKHGRSIGYNCVLPDINPAYIAICVNSIGLAIVHLLLAIALWSWDQLFLQEDYYLDHTEFETTPRNI